MPLTGLNDDDEIPAIRIIYLRTTKRLKVGACNKSIKIIGENFNVNKHYKLNISSTLL